MKYDFDGICDNWGLLGPHDFVLQNYFDPNARVRWTIVKSLTDYMTSGF